MSAVLTIPVRAQTDAHALSPSQAITFLDCAARWYFGTVAQLPNPKNGALALGHAVHRTAAAVMRGKGAHAGQLPTLTDALGVFEAVWKDELDQAQLAPDENADAIGTTGRKIVAKWHNQVAPDLEPAAVELVLIGKIAGTEVHAIADLITTDGTVHDLKTAGKRPGKLSADHAFQLTTYALLAAKSTARLITITKADAPAVVQYTLAVGPEHRRHAEAIYPIVAAAMRSGIYPPRRASHLCSRKHCPFWQECVSEFGGDVN